MNMTKREVAFIQAKVDLFEQWEMEERHAALKCVDKDEAEQHYVESVKCGSAADALRNILFELGV